MGLDQMFTNGQSNAAATAGTGTRFIDPVKSFEDVGQLIGREANTCICYSNQ
jgi:hypothetical protein